MDLKSSTIVVKLQILWPTATVNCQRVWVAWS